MIFLFLLAMAIGAAAYNSANNILFITLALLLACLILSGVLSWLNFRGLEWDLGVSEPLRAGQTATALVSLSNHKRLLPTYGIWFMLGLRNRPTKGLAESTV